MTKFKGYNLFNDEKNPLLKTYNRLMEVSNIKELEKPEVLNGYLEAIKATGRKQINALAAYANIKGMDFIKAEVTRSVGS